MKLRLKELVASYVSYILQKLFFPSLGLCQG